MVGPNTDYTHNFDFNTGQITTQTRDGCVPRFFIKREPDQRTGVIKEVEYVEINVIGDRLSKRRPVVTDEHRARWGREYDAFKRGIELQLDGTGLAQWPVLDDTMISEFQRLGFRTVEHVAAATDSQIQNLQGGFGWRRAAQNFIEEQKITRIDPRDAQIALLTEQVNKLISMQGAATNAVQPISPVSFSSGARDDQSARRGRDSRASGVKL